MTTTTNETMANAASALMHCTGSVAVTSCDGDKQVTVVNVEGVDVVMVDAKAELAEIMTAVESRKKFYNKAMASLRAIYAIEKSEREDLKVLKAGLATTKQNPANPTAPYEDAIRSRQESLAETMQLVFARKKFFNRVSKSYQQIVAVERRHRAAMKVAKTGTK